MRRGMKRRTGPRPGSRTVVWIALLVAAAGYGIIWHGLTPAIFSHSKSDFSCFYRAGQMVLAGDGARVYDLPTEREYDHELGTQAVSVGGDVFSLPFVFPPFALAIFAPLACLSYRAAEAAWYAVNASLLLALPLLLRRHFAWNSRAVAFALLAPLPFVPVLLALMQGQPSVLLLFLFALCFVDLVDGKQARTGCWLAVAMVKPQFVIPALLALAVCRKWKALKSFGITCAALFGISVATVGWRGVVSYPQALVQFSTLSANLGGEHPGSMPNLRGLLDCLFHAAAAAVTLERLTIALSLLVLLTMAITLGRRRRISEVSFSLVLFCTLLISHHAYLHDDALLLLPLFFLAEYIRHTDWSGRRRMLMGALVLVYLVPLAPISLCATAMSMCAMTAICAAMVSIEVAKEDAPAIVCGRVAARLAATISG